MAHRGAGLRGEAIPVVERNYGQAAEKLRRAARAQGLLLLALLALLAGCRSEREASIPSDGAVNLADHLAAARIEGSEPPKDPPAALEWSFAAPRTDWKPAPSPSPRLAPAATSHTGDALRIELGAGQRIRNRMGGGVYVDLPAGSDRHDWAYAVVRARAIGGARSLTLGANLRDRLGETVYEILPFAARGESLPVVADGSVQRYVFAADWGQEDDSAWRQLGLLLEGQGETASVELLSVSLVPKAARFGKEKAGLAGEAREAVYRRALFLHAPGKVTFPVTVPRGGRLDFALGVLAAEPEVGFRVEADGETLWRETYRDKARWGQRSVDLGKLAGKTVEISLAVDAETPGTVALWGAPTLSGATEPRRPNVILYVIDGGGALYSSAYGSPRRTTPNLERLAAEGVLFENAYSNSSWSKPSTQSFMTSLHHTVLGGYKNPADPLPDQATTMAEQFHAAGYQTAVLTSNTWCGVMSSLGRGVDYLRETVPVDNSFSSRFLHGELWRWLDAYPGRPFWAHFQTTDVHWPWQPVPPIAGTFVSRAEREELYAIERKLGQASGLTGREWALRAEPQQFEAAGVDWKRYFDLVRGVFDEAMAVSDAEIGRLVAQLQARGEWDDTLLVVTADHGDWPGLGLFESLDADTRVPYFNPYITRVPLIVVWPRGLRESRRIAEPVSLIDLLPTLLDLTSQEVPQGLQGQSLAPLLRGRPGYTPRPVILDELTLDPKTGERSGVIEIVDGRWAASLALGKKDQEPHFFLCDLWDDPYCRKSLHQERPDLVKKYRALLGRTLREHHKLAKGYTRSGEGALNAEQLNTLRSLGYI